MNFLEHFIPSSLNSAIDFLCKNISEDDIAWIKTQEDAVPSLHDGLGRSLRNAWSLWDKETHLVRFFQLYFDIGHADDISGLIMTGMCKALRKEPFDPYEEVKRYHEHWFKRGIDPKTLEKMT